MTIRLSVCVRRGGQCQSGLAPLVSVQYVLRLFVRYVRYVHYVPVCSVGAPDTLCIMHTIRVIVS
jgi:hypothetical protein